MINIKEYKNSYYNEFLTREELWKKYGGTRRESFALFSSMNPKRDYKKVMNRSYKKNDSMRKRAENNLVIHAHLTLIENLRDVEIQNLLKKQERIKKKQGEIILEYGAIMLEKV